MVAAADIAETNKTTTKDEEEKNAPEIVPDEPEVLPYGEETRPAEMPDLQKQAQCVRKTNGLIQFVNVIYWTDFDKNRSELLDWNI